MDDLKRITIEPTNNCNLNCLECPRHYLDMPIGYMDWQLFSQIVDQIPKSVTDIILAWRGEPTIHPDIHGMFYRAPIFPVIATNGKFIERIPLNKCKAINLSVHNKQSVYDLLFLMDVKGDNPVRITVSRVAGAISDDIWHQVKGVGGAVEFRTYQRHSDGGLWGSVKQDKRRYHLPSRREGLCSRLETDLVIAWDGSVSRCCYVFRTIPGLDANKMSLDEIWNSPQLQHIRDNYPDDICKNCDQWQTERTL